MADVLRVLIVEDNPGDAEDMVLALQEDEIAVEWERVQTRKDFLAALTRAPDIVLCDYSLPGWSAEDALAIVRAGPLLPFIVVTGSTDRKITVDMIQRRGADNFIVKYNLSSLGPSVLNLLASYEDKRQRLKAERERDTAELALQVREARYHLIFDIMQEVVLLVDAHGIIQMASAATEKVFGWPAGELVGQPLITLIPERLRASHLTGFRRYLETRQPHLPSWTSIPGLSGLHRDGHEVPLEISFSETEEEGYLMFVGVLRDLTALQQSATAVATLRATLEEVRAQIASLRGPSDA